MPGVDNRFNGTEQCGGIAGRKGVDGIVDQRDIGGAQESKSLGVVHPVSVGAGQQLVENAQRVPR